MQIREHLCSPAVSLTVRDKVGSSPISCLGITTESFTATSLLSKGATASFCFLRQTAVTSCSKRAEGDDLFLLVLSTNSQTWLLGKAFEIVIIRR